MSEDKIDPLERKRSTEGNSISKGSMTVAEAGKRGGEKTARTHGHEFYQEIGHKGGKIGGRKVKELIEEGKRARATGRRTD